MICPQCKYVMDDFDKECPRCHGKGLNKPEPELHPDLSRPLTRNAPLSHTKVPQAAQVREQRCMNCSTPIMAGQRFCPTCGAEVGTGAMPKVASVPQTPPAQNNPIPTMSAPQSYAAPPTPIQTNTAEDSPLALFGYAFFSALIPCIGFIVGLVSVGKNPQRGGACIIGSILGFVLGLALLSGGPNSTGSYSGSGSSDTFSLGAPSSTIVTMNHYNQIQNGMSYSQVCQIIGTPGTEETSNRMEGVPGVMDSVTTVSYRWMNGNGGNMSCMFQNDKMVMKAQFGLP